MILFLRSYLDVKLKLSVNLCANIMSLKSPFRTHHIRTNFIKANSLYKFKVNTFGAAGCQHLLVFDRPFELVVRYYSFIPKCRM